MKIYDIFPIALSILTVFCISCTKQSDALDAALAKAGNNQEEIQKVLDYFRKDTKDSLKYKAALF